eukprot:771317-Pleurochrysis_carterae.AAC.1
MRSTARQVDRSDAGASRALEWHRKADGAAAARSQCKRNMTSYRSAMGNLAREKQRHADELAEERRLRVNVGAECAQLRAEVSKANVQLR